MIDRAADPHPVLAREEFVYTQPGWLMIGDRIRFTSDLGTPGVQSVHVGTVDHIQVTESGGIYIHTFNRGAGSSGSGQYQILEESWGLVFSPAHMVERSVWK